MEQMLDIVRDQIKKTEINSDNWRLSEVRWWMSIVTEWRKCWRIRMLVWWTSYAGRLNTIGTRVEQGICYVLDQTDKVSSPTGLSIYTQGKRGYTLWLCYESILLLVNICLLIMMQYHTILMWLDRYSNRKDNKTHQIDHFDGGTDSDVK